MVTSFCKLEHISKSSASDIRRTDPQIKAKQILCQWVEHAWILYYTEIVTTWSSNFSLEDGGSSNREICNTFSAASAFYTNASKSDNWKNKHHLLGIFAKIFLNFQSECEIHKKQFTAIIAHCLYGRGFYVSLPFCYRNGFIYKQMFNKLHTLCELHRMSANQLDLLVLKLFPQTLHHNYSI